MTKTRSKKQIMESSKHSVVHYQGQQFIVKTEKGLMYVLSALCFLVFCGGIFFLTQKKFKPEVSDLFYVLFLLASIKLFLSARNNNVIIRINKDGIFYYEKKITDWEHFLKAYIKEKENKKAYSISDQFQLTIEFTKEDPRKGFRKKIPLTNTQNQSEEDVLTAIKYFWHLYANKNGLI